MAQFKVNQESCLALLNNGCQINTVTLELIEAHSLDVGQMSDLVDGEMNMDGTGRKHTHPLGYVIMRVQVDGLEGYDKYQIALVIPDMSKFVSRVPVILGTLMIGRVTNVRMESELDTLATPWVNAWVTYLLACCRSNMSLINEVANWPMNLTDLNKIAKTKKTKKIELFSSKVTHSWNKMMFMGCNMHMMRHAPGNGDKILPHGLAIQNMYAKMVNGSKSMVVLVGNLTVTLITLENTPVARVVAATAVSYAKIQPGMVEQLDAAKGAQTGKPKMTVEQQGEVLCKWLDLSGLDSWMSKNKVVGHSHPQHLLPRLMPVGLYRSSMANY